MESSTSRFSRIKKQGIEQRLLEDIYHSLLKMPWWKFITSFFIFILVFNFIFAALFWLFPETIKGSDGSLFESFAFSVQTFSTVGYGVFSPNTVIGHIFVITESLSSVLVTAVFTGLIYAKFSRPRARVIFSKNILITQLDGHRHLVFRVGNLRNNLILEAEANVVLLKSYKTVEGHTMRKQYDVILQRRRTSFFALTWVLFHKIDESSPLFGIDEKELQQSDIQIGVSITGHDETFSQNIFASCFYDKIDFVFNKHFRDVIINKNGQVSAVDYQMFHELIP